MTNIDERPKPGDEYESRRYPWTSRITVIGMDSSGRVHLEQAKDKRTFNHALDYFNDTYKKVRPKIVRYVVLFDYTQGHCDHGLTPENRFGARIYTEDYMETVRENQYFISEQKIEFDQPD